MSQLPGRCRHLEVCRLTPSSSADGLAGLCFYRLVSLSVGLPPVLKYGAPKVSSSVIKTGLIANSDVNISNNLIIV